MTFSLREAGHLVDVAGRWGPSDQATAPRRPGDPAAIVPKLDKIRNALGWQPEHDEWDLIVSHVLAWESRIAELKHAAS